MIKSYIKIALRHLRKQKVYAAVKVGGFALGIAACLLIALYIQNELSYDKFYPDTNRIYRVLGTITIDGKINKGLDFPAPFGKAIKADFPEIEKSGRLMTSPLFWGAGSNQIRPSDNIKNTYEQGFAYIDQDLLDILKLPMIYGSGSTALTQPLTMVISRRKADKYFPGRNPVGSVVYLNDDKRQPYTIGGVMADIPQNSHLSKFDFFLTLTGKELWQGEQQSWEAWNYSSYILLKEGTDIAQFEKKLSDGVMKKYIIPVFLKIGLLDAAKKAHRYVLSLQPMADINLYSYDIDDSLIYGDIRFVWLFGAIALFILVLACINFINLSTAKSATRAKEVGLRKVIGSRRSSLINQFLTESLIYSLISFVLGVLLAALLMPYFNALAGKSLSLPWLSWWFYPLLLGAAVLVGASAGLYPAFYLSAFKPAQVLKGPLSSGSKNPVLRNSLVVFQFTISVILVISTVVIYKQMQFILNRKVGFDKEQVLVLQGTNTISDTGIRSFKTELSRLSSVKSVSISDYLPVNGTKRNGNTFFNEGRVKIDPGVSGQFWQVDDTYRKTLGIQLVAGRNFSYNRASDLNAVIINQTMAKKLNLKDPVGKMITNTDGVFRITGVVQDFNFESMRAPIEPLVLHFGLSPSIVSVKVSGAHIQKTIADITAVWEKFAPAQPIRYSFLDEQFASMYIQVQRTGHVFTSFAILAIVIACLGLFALSAFMAEQRRKEIGIRKVLGASIQGITTMLSVNFIKLVIIAIVIASPVAWWGLNKWLQDFAYRIQIQWWMFALAGLAAIFIALATVSFQSVKAALANPAESLKNE